jgi:hypothetical protein
MDRQQPSGHNGVGQAKEVPMAALLLTVTLASLWPPVPSLHVRRTTFDSVREQRNSLRQPRQVEALLGGPPGDYRTRPTSDAEPPGFSVFEVSTRDQPRLIWRADEGDLEVRFRDGVVCFCSYTPRERVSVGPTDWMLWRVGQWRSVLSFWSWRFGLACQW